MTLAQVIEEIKALEPADRTKVLDFLLAVEAAGEVQCVDEKTFDDIAERVIERHADLMEKLAQ